MVVQKGKRSGDNLSIYPESLLWSQAPLQLLNVYQYKGGAWEFPRKLIISLKLTMDYLSFLSLFNMIVKKHFCAICFSYSITSANIYLMIIFLWTHSTHKLLCLSPSNTHLEGILKLPIHSKNVPKHIRVRLLRHYCCFHRFLEKEMSLSWRKPTYEN